LVSILNDKQHLIWDTVNEEIVTKIEPFGFEDEFGLRINQIVMYSGNDQIDNGYYDTTDQFSVKINRYKIINLPENPEIVEILKKLA
jgi:hypothetical protein